MVVGNFRFPASFPEAFPSLALLVMVMMFLDSLLLTCALAAGAVPRLSVQETLEVEATVPVQLAEAAHHHVLWDLVTCVLVTGAALLL